MPYFYEQDKLTPKALLPGVKARLMWGEKVMMGLIDIEANSIVPKHSHPHEQCGRILSGSAWFKVGGETKLLREGDHYVIPGGVEHEVKTGDTPCFALDIWSPIRDEYLADDVRFFNAAG